LERWPAQYAVAIAPYGLIAGTLTNVCCEHGAALDTFVMFFGDAMNIEEVTARLKPAAIGLPAQ
jgi:hypothetical protein